MIRSPTETSYKETFRVFSKDEEGCIPAEEIK
jgi:Ca2+-binding EF-hand superfamily protein